jgi:DNA-binding NtrC family response regulator
MKKYKQARAEAVAQFESSYVRDLIATYANVSEAARQAHIDRVYLHRLMRRHGLGLTPGAKAAALSRGRPVVEATAQPSD